jgi:hypothetical protein
MTEAKAKGRTNGLDGAINLLKEAYNFYHSNNYEPAVRKAEESKKAAEEAVNPSFIESYGLLTGVLGILIVATGGSLAVKWRNNKRKIPDNGGKNEEV